MKQLPSSVLAYKKTKVFNDESIPQGLLKDHRTLKGVWGVINIIEGELLYIITSNPLEKIKLTKDFFGVVEPEQLHFVKPIGRVKFYVEFYK